ncbi:MAG TPA: electron transfer flavoprotein subunit alpha/FixB family protein [Burkholderiales bacterium]|nr:electron transfer flavoprotein subunit alpha/FixB family protein [Burkholderiales bacterium]
MSELLVVVELAQGKPAAVSLELVGLARRLAAQTGGGRVSVLVFSRELAIADLLIARGADRVFTAADPAVAEYNSDISLAYAVKATSAAAATLVLAGHTAQGADLAPRLAFRLKSVAATGCVSVTADRGVLLFTRSCYGGNARETVSLKTVPAVATVRGGCYDAMPADAARRGDIISLTGEIAVSRIRVIERRRGSGEQARLEDARVIVAGGRGLNGPEGFRLLEELADALGGVVGASRVPCDLGWCSHSMQIGLTGKTVTPDLYIAVGISGASHHLAGCGNAKTIVAVNTDPAAAIFRQAHYGIVGDFQKVVPALATEVRKLGAAQR